jgi:DNA-binding LytR/AlgR family response regulator
VNKIIKESELISNASILVVEDDLLIAMDIKELLIKFGCKRVECSDNVGSALYKLSHNKFDLVLLDINFGKDKRGTELGLFLSEQLNIPHIYITAYSDLSTLNEVSKSRSSGFLLKPFSDKMLYSLIQLALSSTEARDNRRLNEKHEMELNAGLDYINIKLNGIENRIPLNEIRYFQTDNSYIDVYTIKKKYILRNSLANLSEHFKHCDFVRCHKKYLVNLNFVNGFNGKFLFLADIKIPVGRSMKESVLQRLRNI